MYSIFFIGKHFGKPTNVFNILGLAAFIMLLAEPLQLFQVGFQFSFLAVTGIVIDISGK